MGITTPNIGIYIPAAGETNYQDSFAAGMVNIDQHDHSGGPNKGVPINTSGIADFAITYNLLNANVVDPTTGVGVNALLPNQIQILGLLRSIFQLATATGFLTKNGTIANARTFQDTATIEWTNPAGVAGNPSANLAATVTTNVQGTANQIDASAVVLGVQTLSLSANVVNANQSAFKGNATTPQSNVTGDGSSYTVLFGSVSGTPVFNQGNNYNTGTSVYTAPITGNYFFQTTVALNGIATTSNFTVFQFVINGTPTYTMFAEQDIADVSGSAVIQGGQIMRLTAGDTVSVLLNVTNFASIKSVNVIGGDFTGLLLPA